MLAALASPLVCVIDDEKDDYEPLLAILNECFVGAIHLLGSSDCVPPEPFKGLRLIFLDLHLTAAIGKTAASHTANFFLKTVATVSAPLIVVIWSKYASDISGEEETESDLFKRTLLIAAPCFKDRLIFVEMEKPKVDDRPQDWRKKLKDQIQTSLRDHQAIEVMWSWNELVMESCAEVCRDMTSQAASAGSTQALQDNLKDTMRRLADAQSGGYFGPKTAPSHLVALLNQLLVDQLEHPSGIARIAPHGDWLGVKSTSAPPAGFAGKMNGLLLTSELGDGAAIYSPGTVFRIKSAEGFECAFGKKVNELLEEWIGPAKKNYQDWRKDALPVLIELSPACDVAQSNRISTLLVAGFIAPKSYASKVKISSEAFGKILNFYLRWPVEGMQAQEIVLGYCNRYKTTLPAASLAAWLAPWFRLRELPTASIRNSNAAHAARVGFVSL